jgi:RHS repeat-associated protein
MNQNGYRIGHPTDPIDQLTFSYQTNSNKLSQVTDAANDAASVLGDFHYTTKGAYDYSYDSAGNLTQDKNKGIDTIVYNYLNLPQLVHVNGKGNILYTYDAAGTRLKKQVIDSLSGLSTTTLYLSGFQYQRRTPMSGMATGVDTLLFTGHEEGRARWAFHRHLAGDSAYGWEYDFAEKDHLGNTRVLLTQGKDTAAYLATMEGAYRKTEDALFYGIDSTAYARTGVPGYPNTGSNDTVARVNGNGPKTGPAIILKVMAGDEVDIGVNYYYNSATGSNGPGLQAKDLLSSLASGLATLSAPAHSAFASLNDPNTSPLLAAMNSSIGNQTGTGPSKPQAYLNWVLLDNQFNYVGGNNQSAALQVGASGTQSNGQLQTPLAFRQLPISKSGYLYIYVSNATPGWDVFFDNLSVTHYSGPMLEENHYYPGGLTMAGISDKALKGNYAENKYRFNAGSEQENKEFSDGSGLEMYDTRFRQLDVQLGGRFWQQDPLAITLVNISPYQFATNNPVSFSDPLGLDTIRISGEGAHKIQIREGDVLAWTIGEKTSYYTYDPTNENAVNGFIGAGISDGTLQEATVTAGRERGDNASPWKVGTEWLTGRGPREHHFRGADPFTRKLREHEHIAQTRDLIASGLANHKLALNQQYSNNYALGGFSGVPKYLRDYSTLFTGGLTGNIAVTYLGSYSLTYKILSVDEEDGTARVHFTVSNSSTIESATHPPVIGYTQWWTNNIGRPLNNYFSSGPLSKTTQTFDWNETIKFK